MEIASKECESAAFVSASDQLHRMKHSVESCTARQWNQMQMEFENRVKDEFSHKLLFCISRDKEKYYLQNGDLFGEVVTKSFPSEQGDIEEAGKCYAAGRSTACVFHLMRVMEFGLRALAKTLNEPKLDPSRNPTWEPYCTEVTRN